MYRRSGLKSLFVVALLAVAVLFAAASTGHASGSFNEPTCISSVPVNGYNPMIAGEVTAMFVGNIVWVDDIVNGDIDKANTFGVGTVTIVASCQGNEFVLGPGRREGISLEEFEVQTDPGTLTDEATELGCTAPAGCYSAAGGQHLRIKSVPWDVVDSQNIETTTEGTEVTSEVERLVVRGVVIVGD